MTTNKHYDYLIVGAGIIGLTIARELSINNDSLKILIIEKEKALGLHASGRNSGVLHSGVYYQKETLKAKVCSAGARLMENYCHDNNLPIKKTGKVIVPTRHKDQIVLDRLAENAKNINLNYEVINNKELHKIEPCTKSLTGYSLYLPDVSVVDSKSILMSIVNELKKSSVSICFNERLMSVDIDKTLIATNKRQIKFSYLINAAGQYADQVGQMFGIGNQYTIIPFKGSYYKLRSGSSLFSNGLIYPVADLKRPFLGVHTVKDIDGNTYFGPTAVPVLGRENYSGIEGVNINDAARILYHLSKMYYKNRQGFRYYVHHEALNNIKSRFTKSAQKLVSGLLEKDLIYSSKCGIRPQLINKETSELVMDLKIEETECSFHILNAISPAFTASFAFAELIVGRVLKGDKFDQGVTL